MQPDNNETKESILQGLYKQERLVLIPSKKKLGRSNFFESLGTVARQELVLQVPERVVMPLVDAEEFLESEALDQVANLASRKV